MLLDKPLSQPDSLTRFELQDTLLRVWERSGKAVVMVTHASTRRSILMNDGPEATVGDVLPVPFPGPRGRAAVLGHPQYHACRFPSSRSCDVVITCSRPNRQTPRQPT
jgi:ABC-type nitrate/sulfonate/bicarbonate transport system ATPase subunit